MAGGKSLEERSESGSIERSSHETPAGVKLQTGGGGSVSHETPAGVKLQTGEVAVKYPSAPRKIAVPQYSNSRKTVSAPRGDASHESDPDALEDGGGDLSKKKVGGAERREVRCDGSAASDKVVRKLTYSSAQKGPGVGVKGKEVVVTRRLSKSKRACLVMPVAKVLAGLKKGRYAPRVRDDAAVYLAATLEYLVAEVLELAGNCSKYMKRKRVTPHHIQMTFLHDSELGELTKGVIVPEGGVKPNILKELLPPQLHMKANDDAEDSEAANRAASTDVSSH